MYFLPVAHMPGSVPTFFVRKQRDSMVIAQLFALVPPGLGQRSCFETSNQKCEPSGTSVYPLSTTIRVDVDRKGNPRRNPSTRTISRAVSDTFDVSPQHFRHHLTLRIIQMAEYACKRRYEGTSSCRDSPRSNSQSKFAAQYQPRPLTPFTRIVQSVALFTSMNKGECQ